MVRFVLGEVEIPWGARIMQSADSLDEPERRAISVLTGAEQIERQRSLWIGRETLIATKHVNHMASWREKLFVTMQRNATNATTYFKLPSSQVIELGSQVEI